VSLGRGDGTINFNQVLQSLTGARLKLERLQVSLLHALGSVASRMDGYTHAVTQVVIPANLVDEATMLRLHNVLKNDIIHPCHPPPIHSVTLSYVQQCGSYVAYSHQ
jgi:hypothetical protein